MTETGSKVESPSLKMKSKLIKHKGHWFPVVSFSNDQQFEAIRNFPLHDSDILVASYQKSGATVLQYMVYLILHDGVIRADGNTMQERIPFMDRDPQTTVVAARMQSPRLLKTHMPYGCLPAAVEAGHGKVIYVARNPKDLCVSLFHFFGIMVGQSIRGEFPDFFERFKAGYISRGPWVDHVSAYWDHRSDKNVLFLLFEDMLQHPEETVSKIADFLGRPLTDQQISHIVNKTRFDVMSNDPAVNFKMHPFLKVSAPKESKMRKGQIGDWMNYFTPDMERETDELFVEPLRSRGLTFVDRMQ